MILLSFHTSALIRGGAGDGRVAYPIGWSGEGRGAAGLVSCAPPLAMHSMATGRQYIAGCGCSWHAHGWLTEGRDADATRLTGVAWRGLLDLSHIVESLTASSLEKIILKFIQSKT